jgi:hypothetical protein
MFFNFSVFLSDWWMNFEEKTNVFEIKKATSKGIADNIKKLLLCLFLSKLNIFLLKKQVLSHIKRS